MAKKNEIIEVRIDEVGFPNKGQGSYEENKVILKGGIRGQVVKARVTRKRKGKIEGKILEVVEKSPLETAIPCDHFGICGGCSYQTLAYEKELEYKEDQIRSLFKKEGLEIDLEGIEKSPLVKGYRNKMEYTFGDEEKDGPLALGLHRKGRFYEVVNIPDCNIGDDDFTSLRQGVLAYFRNKETPYFRKKDHTGYLRHLVIRKSLTKGDILLNLVTSSQGSLNEEEFVEMVKAINTKGPVVGILHTINDSMADIVQADDLKLLYGRDYIVEEILGLKFNISPFSFFQTNTFAAEKLYSIVRDYAGDIENKLVFDLYSGTGTIAQVMAPLAKKVIGIEIVEEAVEKARENALINGLHNIDFIVGDVLKAVDDLDEKPDLIVIDPPRDGIHPKAIDKIIDFNPHTFVYVSCNPLTLVRDLKVFLERGYRIEKGKLMDQFPRTPHVECVALMSRVEK